VNEFFSIYLIFPATLGPGIYSASNRNEYQKQEMYPGSRVRKAHKTDNLHGLLQGLLYFTFTHIRHEESINLDICGLRADEHPYSL
jgi:hypothetical protein